jgi:sodium transport system permease protein
MRPAIIWTIARKELREALRDRLTVLVVFVLPILIYPLLIVGLSKLQESHEATQEQRKSTVAVWGQPGPELEHLLSGTNILQIEPWKNASPELQQQFASGQIAPPPETTHPTAARRRRRGSAPESIPGVEAPSPVRDAALQAITGRQVDAVLVIWPGFEDTVKRGGLAPLSVYYDSVHDESAKAQDRLATLVAQHRRDLLAARERDHNLPTGFTRAVDLRSLNLASNKRQLGQILGTVLPFLLVVLSATGSLYAAIDLTAGEKDRGTMQTLLCAPIGSGEIVAGKFLAVCGISLASVCANTVSMGAALTRLLASGGQLNIPVSVYVLTLVMLLPITITVSAAFLAIAVLARDAKDAGNLLGATLILLMLPLGTVLTPGIELDHATAFVPLVNIALLIKTLFIGEGTADLVFLTLTSSTIYAMWAVLFAARVFGREQVLLGGKDGLASVFRREGGGPASLWPNPPLVLGFYGIVFVVIFYGSLLLERLGIAAVVLVNGYGFMLLPTLLFALVMRMPARETFGLWRPHWRAVAGAILVGVSAWIAVGGLVSRLWRPPDELVRALEKLLLLGERPQSLWVVWLVIGLTPAITEELLFRGLILQGLRRWGKWKALLVSSLLFALAHSSIYRLAPTLFLGLILGWVAWRSGSIFTSMLVHFLNNGLVATLVFAPSVAVALGFNTTNAEVPLPLMLVGCVVTCVGLWLVHSTPEPPPRAAGPPAQADVPDR